MAIVGSAVGSFDPVDTTATLKRIDLFDGATPKAAIVTVAQNIQGTNSYNEWLTGIAWGVGAITPDEQWACGVINKEGEADSDCFRRSASDAVVSLPYPSYGAGSTAAVMTGALVTDGITLTKSGNWYTTGLGGSREVFIEVTFFGGDDFSAWIPPGSLVTSTTRVGDIPFMPNTGFFAGIGHDVVPLTLTDARLSQGWLFDNGVAAHDECCRAIRYPNAAATGSSGVNMRSGNFYSSLSASMGATDTAEHTNFDIDGAKFEHNYTVSNEGDFGFMPLYMRLENEDCYVGPITLPSSTGTYTSTGYGHDPSVVKLFGNSAANSYNSTKDGVGSGNNFDWTIEGSSTSITTWNDENKADIDCRTRLDLGTCVSYDDPFTGGYRAIDAQRVPAGFTMDVEQKGALAAAAFVVTLGTAAESGLNIALGDDLITTAYLGADEVSAVYLGSDSIGGTSGWGTFYRDAAPAQNEGDWIAGPEGTLSQDSGGILWTASGAAFTSVGFAFTTVPGEDYRITVVTGAGGNVSTTAVIRDFAGTAFNLVPNIVLGSGSASAVMNFKAVSTSTRFDLAGVVAISDTILIESILIEEMR